MKSKEEQQKNCEEVEDYYYKDKDSYKERNSAYYQKNKDKYIKYARIYHLKNNLGLTLEDYEQMLIKQDFSCAICGIHMFKLNRRLAVDHDHKTGKIRSLLCHKCNVALGHFNDDMELLRNAYEYLKYHKKLLI